MNMTENERRVFQLIQYGHRSVSKLKSMYPKQEATLYGLLGSLTRKGLIDVEADAIGINYNSGVTRDLTRTLSRLQLIEFIEYVTVNNYTLNRATIKGWMKKNCNIKI